MCPRSFSLPGTTGTNSLFGSVLPNGITSATGSTSAQQAAQNTVLSAQYAITQALGSLTSGSSSNSQHIPPTASATDFSSLRFQQLLHPRLLTNTFALLLHQLTNVRLGLIVAQHTGFGDRVAAQNVKA